MAGELGDMGNAAARVRGTWVCGAAQTERIARLGVILFSTGPGRHARLYPAPALFRLARTPPREAIGPTVKTL